MNKLYQEVIVSYDIEDNKSRTKLFKQLKAMSLVAIQKSVFWGHLKLAEEQAVKRLFHKHCDTCDKAFLVRVKLSENIKHNSKGYKHQDFPSQPSTYEVL